MKKYILTLDEGTTSARAIIFDRAGKIISSAQKEFSQIFPQPSFVEQDPLEIYSAQYSALTEALLGADISPSQIAALGITNQRETVIVWDKTTGKPIYNAIVWQCRRTADMCEQLKTAGLEDFIIKTTGLKIDAYFSATKIKWILDNVSGARQKANAGELLFGTVDSWLLWKLSGGKIHLTDTTNASRTMLFNIHTLSWDDRLLEIFDIPKCMLPEVLPSGSHFGDVNIMGEAIPVCGIAGDQQSALFGQRCFKSGDMKNTYGTGCFLLMNTGNTAFSSKNGLLTTVAATLKGESAQYALEGSVFIGGAVIQWLRDEMGLISNASESEQCANSVENSGGVYIVPAFAGLGAPYWNMYAKGTICGLTRGSSKNHIVRAALEAIAYQTNDLISAMRQDTGLEVKQLLADGGAAKNGFLMQFQSDVSNTEVIAPKMAEATALGAAFLAGLTCGFFESREQISDLNTPINSYKPNISEGKRAELISGWKKAINSTAAFK